MTLKQKKKFNSEQSELTTVSVLYNLIHSRFIWKTLVVDSVVLPENHTFVSRMDHPLLLGLGMRAGQRSKQEKMVRKHISLMACGRKLFTTGKYRPLLPSLEHRGFVSLIIAVRFLSVNNKLLMYKVSSAFVWKMKK